MNIPIARTVFERAEFQAIHKPLESGWVVQGPFVKEFEEKWSSFTGIAHAIATSNCTTALHLSLVALGIGPKDEVIVPAFTWVATANVVESLGAKPVFCDIDLHTFNIAPSAVEACVTSRTKAIMPVHLFGLAAEMDQINEIARQHGLLVIEDAACGFAAKYKGKHVGGFGHTGCFSFHPRKAITTGEGGMITTDNEELANKLRAMRDHGATLSDRERHLAGRPYTLPDFPYLGFNYRLTDIQAAIGSSQMDRATEIHTKRVAWADKYDALLDGLGWLEKPYRDEDHAHGFQAYVSLFVPEPPSLKNLSAVNKQRNCFMDYLQSKGISTRPGTHAVHMLDYYAKKYDLRPEHYPQAWIAGHCSVAMPLFPSLIDEEFDHIAAAIATYKV
jgi:perosamine synthetase